MSRAPANIEDFSLPIPPPTTTDLLDELLGGFEVSLSEAEVFSDPHWVYENLIIDGHITVIVAEPNGGKTALMWHLSPLIRQKGYQVFYINSDIGASDARSMIPEAQAGGFRLLLPDIKGDGMPDVIDRLIKLAKSGQTLSRTLIIIDTLKKASSPNQKEQMRNFMKLCRKLTGQGATLVLLGHTNKYYNDDGLPQYEGVGDIRSDTDELIYLLPRKNPDGTRTISTIPDKIRGQFTPISFKINEDRTVTQLDRYIDLQASKVAELQYLKDREEIEEIHEVLDNGPQNQSAIVMETHMNQRHATKLLRRYKNKQWTMKRGDKNSKVYQSIVLQQRWPQPFDVTEDPDQDTEHDHY